MCGHQLKNNKKIAIKFPAQTLDNSKLQLQKSNHHKTKYSQEMIPDL